MDEISDKQLSQTGFKTEFLAFQLPPTQSSVENTFEVEVKPTTSLLPAIAQSVEFFIPASSTDFIDLETMFLRMRFKYSGKELYQYDSSATPPNAGTARKLTDYSPIQNLMGSMIKRVELTLNGRVVNTNNNYYGYRSFIENLLGTSHEAKKTYLRSAGWVVDLADNDWTEPSANRKKHFPAEKDLELYGTLHLDLAGQDNVLLNGIDLRLTIETEDYPFWMQCKWPISDFKFEWQEMSLFVTKKKATTPQLQYIERSLSSMPALYPVRRIEVTHRPLFIGAQVQSIGPLFTGLIPSRLIVGLVDNSAFHGHTLFNPYEFRRMTMRSISVSLDGGELVPRVPFKPLDIEELDSFRFNREYISLLRGLGKLNPAPVCDLTLEHWHKGLALYCFNLTADGSDSSSGHFNPTRRGSMSLNFEFTSAPETATSVVLFAEFDGLITIDRHRQVQVAY